jgi:hypothetical protein
MARAIVILVTAALGLTAQAATAGTYSVSLEARGTHVGSGLVFGQTEMVSDAGAEVSVGESAYVYLSFWRLPSGDYCNRASGGSGSLEEMRQHQPEPGHEAFLATIRPLGTEIGKVRFEVDWERLRRDGSGPAVRVGGDVRVVEMPEGEIHVLDFLAGKPTADSYCYANVSIGVRAGVREDEALAGARFGYDVWWKHTDDKGRVDTRRFVGSGRQGETLSFNLGERRQPVPETHEGKRWDSILEMVGEVQARARADGQIDLRLGAGRWVSTELTGTPRTGGIGDGGRKVVTVSPGETIALRLPSPRGRAEFVDSKAFYAGHTDELILTVTREK